MPVVPVLPTIVNPGTATISQINQIMAAIAYLQMPPIFQGRQTIVQNLVNVTFTAMAFDVEDVDSDVDGVGGHSTTVNTSRFTARYPGWIKCSGTVATAASAVGQRAGRWAVNGTPINAATTFYNCTAAGGAIVNAPSQFVYLNIGDYVELHGFQSSGGVLATQIAAGSQSSMTVDTRSK